MTFAQSMALINEYVSKIREYLRSEKLDMSKAFYMQCYSAFLKMCDENDEAPRLYEQYQLILANFVNQEILPNVNKRSGDSFGLLQEFVSLFNKFTIFTQSIKKMFDYLDRYYLKNGTNQENLS